jgi:hypothetical protein
MAHMEEHLHSKCEVLSSIPRIFRGNSILFPIKLLVAACILWFLIPSSITKLHYSNQFLHHHMVFFIDICIPLWRSLWFYWTHLDNQRPFLHLKILNLVISIKSLLLYKVTFTDSRAIIQLISFITLFKSS